jgi:hypothetical protein
MPRSRTGGIKAGADVVVTMRFEHEGSPAACVR